ncbi:MULTISPECIES: PAS domain-containing protein [Olivibacter]|uniref:PAS domain-containing protein n=1 Tax=Olivibacter oleidegradans TaxID=760123 RepID=A0ABV6HNN8_9SPHI|nr:MULTISPECIES: PAS domain-containing protein [Olivibacter]MCL4642009.1 PAS domain-containing protein [Olivibacter sp. UJ_SKK_5.1]MDX3914600.1 PAS domain-containing protein [Pseudosphingobacterium sp.]QEL03231.1 PAS domain S-box protein [Olivibacter sp. LS-1]
MKRTSAPSLPDRFHEVMLRTVSPDVGHLEVDSEHQIVKVDKKAAELLGYSDVNLEGSSLWDVLCEKLPAYHYQTINMAILKRMEHVVYTTLNISGSCVCLKIMPKQQGLRITISTRIPSDFSGRTEL